MDIKRINSDQYRELSDIDHAIQRATMYIGSTKELEGQQFVFFGDGKVHQDNFKFVNGALILASEIINNSFDEYVKRRNNDSVRNIDKIEVVVDLKMKSLTVRDNGGMPIALHEESGLLLPSFLFGKLRTGGNYNDDEREDVGGLNGMGSMLVNLFSKAFHVRVFDDNEKHYFQQTWRNSSRDTYNTGVDNADWRQLLHPCEPTQGMVETIAEFDTTMLPESAYSMEWARMIEMRCATVAAAAAGDKRAPLTVTFKCIHEDGEWDQVFRFRTFEEYLQVYPNSEHYAIDKQENFSIALGLSNGSLESVGVVNGIRCDFGTHIDRYIDACAFHIREHIKVKHNVDVKPAKIKSYMKIVSTFKIPAPEFGGQTKDRLANDVRDIPYDLVPSRQMVTQLTHSGIVRQIVEELHHAILAQRKAELAKRERENQKMIANKAFSPKLTDAALAGKRPGCTLFVVEGDSAAGGFRRYKKNDGTQGVLAMQGKSMGNVIYDDEIKSHERPSFSTFTTAVGLSLVKKPKLRYDNIVLAQDADYDGNCITALILVFIVKYYPWLIEQGRVYKLMTPIAIATKGKETREYYSYDEYNAETEFLEANKWSIKYHKGLSQIKDFEPIMERPKLIQITMDNYAAVSMYTWFGKAPENKMMRKEHLSKALGKNVDEDFADQAYDNELNEISDDAVNAEFEMMAEQI